MDLREQVAEAFALRLNGPASDGRGWYRTDAERAVCHEEADTVIDVVRAVVDAEIARLTERWESSQRNAGELIDRAEKAEAQLKNMTLDRNGANAMMGVHKRTADRLRAELDHAKAALAGDNEGIRLWMIDCGAAAKRLRERVTFWQELAEKAEATNDRVEVLAKDLKTGQWGDPAAARFFGGLVDEALAQPDDQGQAGT